MANEQWRNRIVNYADVDPSQLLANPKNWRIHPLTQRKALKGTIDDIGYVDPVKVQRGSDMVLDGHLRVALALQEDQPTIPVAYLDLDDAEADEMLATFDPLSALAARDQEQLDHLLDSVKSDDDAVRVLLASMSGDVPDFDPNAEWQGMPAFEQEDQMPIKQVTVSFYAVGDMERFSQLVGQKITMKTKGIAYPPTKRLPMKVDVYADDGESDAA